jgi:hypothetical protein
VTQTYFSVSFRGDAVNGCITSGDYATGSDAGPTNVVIYRISGRRQ